MSENEEAKNGHTDSVSGEILKEGKKSGKKKSKENQEKGKKKEGKLLPELISEMYGLKSNLEEIVEKLSLRLQGKISDLIDMIEKGDAESETIKKPSPKQIEDIVKKCKKIKLKPGKGRAKDVVKIDKLLEEIHIKLQSENS